MDKSFYQVLISAPRGQVNEAARQWIEAQMQLWGRFAPTLRLLAENINRTVGEFTPRALQWVCERSSVHRRRCQHSPELIRRSLYGWMLIPLIELMRTDASWETFTWIVDLLNEPRPLRDPNPSRIFNPRTHREEMRELGRLIVAFGLTPAGEQVGKNYWSHYLVVEYLRGDTRPAEELTPEELEWRRRVLQLR